MLCAYVGLPGTGKTCAMTYDAIPIIRAGVKVYSNYPIHWKEKKWSKVTEYKTIFLSPPDFIEAIQYEDNATFLVDEMNVVFSSYDDAKKLDRGLLNRFAQGRKRNLDFFYTSQRFHHSLKRIRDLTNVIIECKKIKFLGLTFFRHIYYNPTIFDREALFDTPLEQKYILQKRFVLPWVASSIFRKYDTNFIVQSSEEFLRKSAPRQSKNYELPSIDI